jgi:hypothetical protein
MLHTKIAERRPASTDSSNCLECRLSGGVSLFVLSGVLYWQRLSLPVSPSPLTAAGLTASSLVLGVLGAARLFNLPPFRRGLKSSDGYREDK